MARNSFEVPGEMIKEIKYEQPLPGAPGARPVAPPELIDEDYDSPPPGVSNAQQAPIAPAAAPKKEGAYSLPRCPECKQFMLVPEQGEPFCPACNPPAIANRIPMQNGKAPIRVPVETNIPAPVEAPISVKGYSTLKGFNAFAPKISKRGTLMVRARQIYASGGWHLSYLLQRDQQYLIRTGLAYDSAFIQHAHMIVGLTTPDLDGEPFMSSTKSAIWFNPAPIDLNGELVLAFYVNGEQANLRQGSFVAEIIPVGGSCHCSSDVKEEVAEQSGESQESPAEEVKVAKKGAKKIEEKTEEKPKAKLKPKLKIK